MCHLFHNYHLIRPLTEYADLNVCRIRAELIGDGHGVFVGVLALGIHILERARVLLTMHVHIVRNLQVLETQTAGMNIDIPGVVMLT